MKFSELKKFLENTINMNTNHQSIMILTLLDNDGKATKETIENKIIEQNKSPPQKRFFDTVYKDLKRHNITALNSGSEDYVFLDYDSYHAEEIKEIKKICSLYVTALENNLEAIRKTSPNDAPTFLELGKLSEKNMMKNIFRFLKNSMFIEESIIPQKKFKDLVKGMNLTQLRKFNLTN